MKKWMVFFEGFDTPGLKHLFRDGSNPFEAPWNHGKITRLNNRKGSAELRF
jgi:hypothetical protein